MLVSIGLDLDVCPDAIAQHGGWFVPAPSVLPPLGYCVLSNQSSIGMVVAANL